MPKLSVTVVAKNEAADLGAALASVAWADEIVVDSHSTDETVAIARQHSDRVVVHDWPATSSRRIRGALASRLISRLTPTSA